MLADPESKALKALGLKNEKAEGKGKGVAYPGVILLNSNDEIVDFAFEDSYRTRPTPGTILDKFFPKSRESISADETEKTDDEYHLSQTGTEGIPGSQWEVLITYRLPEGHHLYAANDKGYTPLQVTFDSNPYFEVGTSIYPDSEIVTLEAIGEKIAVYEGLVEIKTPITVSTAQELKKIKEQLKTKITAKLDYQICTETSCLIPQSVQVEWDALIKPLDRVRAPDSSQHKE